MTEVDENKQKSSVTFRTDQSQEQFIEPFLKINVGEAFTREQSDKLMEWSERFGKQKYQEGYVDGIKKSNS